MEQKFRWYFTIFLVGGVVTTLQASNTLFQFIGLLLVNIGSLNLFNYGAYKRTKELLTESEARIYPERAKNMYRKQEWPDWSDKIWKQFEENIDQKYATYIREREKVIIELEQAEKYINPFILLFLLNTRKLKRTISDYEASLNVQYNCAKSYITILSNLLSRIHFHLDTLYLFKRMNITELHTQKKKLKAVNEQIDFHKKAAEKAKNFQERVDVFTIENLQKVGNEISETMKRISDA